MTTEATTINETTEERGYPLPHPSNPLKHDVGRIRGAMEMVDADVTGLRKRVMDLEDAFLLGLDVV